jgi:hypothetical protein
MTIIIIKKDITSQISTKKPSIQVEFAKKKNSKEIKRSNKISSFLG